MLLCVSSLYPWTKQRILVNLNESFILVNIWHPPPQFRHMVDNQTKEKMWVDCSDRLIGTFWCHFVTFYFLNKIDHGNISVKAVQVKFLDEIDSYVILHGIKLNAADSRCAALHLHLTGPALSWYQPLNDQVKIHFIYLPSNHPNVSVFKTSGHDWSSPTETLYIYCRTSRKTLVFVYEL